MINDDKQFTMLEERKYAEKYCNIHKFENWSNSAYIELTFKAYISIYNGSIYIAISKIKKGCFSHYFINCNGCRDK